MNPRYTLAHHWYGEFLKLLMRHDESIREFRKAVELDPFSIPVRYDFILSLLNAGRIAEARMVVNETAAIDPTATRVLTAEAEVLAAEGKPDEAAEKRFRSRLLGGGSETEINMLRAVYRAGGQRALYERQLAVSLAQAKPGPAPVYFSTNLADLYARLGNRERTLFWLKKAADLDEDAPLLMKTHLYDPMRGDPEFIALERRVGLVR
ncbi:MAG: hypothetical protein JWO80_368 [Bryobacterales bacterium]|nr:hypothetical protein [Bryobacterales bacterium]